MLVCLFSLNSFLCCSSEVYLVQIGKSIMFTLLPDVHVCCHILLSCIIIISHHISYISTYFYILGLIVKLWNVRSQMFSFVDSLNQNNFKYNRDSLLADNLRLCNNAKLLNRLYLSIWLFICFLNCDIFSNLLSKSK